MIIVTTAVDSMDMALLRGTDLSADDNVLLEIILMKSSYTLAVANDDGKYQR